MEDKERRNIKFAFIEVPNFFKNEETREIDKDALVSEIRSINPQIAFMALEYSQTLDLKFLLEASGLFSELRMNRELNIRSGGKILTMNYVQKELVQTMAHEDHIEKDLTITGPRKCGKTLLGLESINIKMSHYVRKYGISPINLKDKLRVIIWVGTVAKKQQMSKEMSERPSYWSLEIHADTNPNPESLKEIFEANENYSSFTHTLIMFDGIWR